MVKCTPLRAVGRQKAREPSGGARGNGRTHLPPSFCVLVHCSLALGQRDQYVQTDRDEKGHPINPAQSDTDCMWGRAGKVDGADGKEACSLFEDLELHPEWGGGTGGIYERLEQEHELCGQQCQNMIRTDLKRR